jgi:hypothetical protein
MTPEDNYYNDPRREADSCKVCEICFWAIVGFAVVGFLAGLLTGLGA